MPISLHPVSRRRFLRQSLLAGAAVALSPRLAASATSRDPNVWALLADTHIPADRTTTNRGINMSDHLTAVVREMVSPEDRSAGVFVVGDLAYSSGESGDYAVLQELLDPVRTAGVPVHLALGNHDHRERFYEVLESERKAGSAVVNRHTLLIRSARANWLMLDSLEKTLQTPGLLGAGQLAWLEKVLDENHDKPAIVIAHHNPGSSENITGLKDTAALFDVIRPRKQVKAFIFGHTHHWSVTRDESGIHLINLPPVAYIFREGNPSGWVRATLLEGGMRMEMRCVDPKHTLQGKVTELRWR